MRLLHALGDLWDCVCHCNGRQKWVSSTILNRSASQGIEFKIGEEIPFKKVESVTIIDDDKLDDDELVEFKGEMIKDSTIEFIRIDKAGSVCPACVQEERNFLRK